MGSGQAITDPFMALLRDVFWKDKQPTVQEAIFGVLWALQHVIECNTGGVNGPPRIGVLTSQEGQVKARLLAEAELGEHAQAIEAAKLGMRNALEELCIPSTAEVPSIPTPTPGK
jgi:hypothetical protein